MYSGLPEAGAALNEALEQIGPLLQSLYTAGRLTPLAAKKASGTLKYQQRYLRRKLRTLQRSRTS